MQVATREAGTVAPNLSVADHADDTQHNLSIPNSNSNINSSSGSCPFLAALPSPPPAQHRWWQRLVQLSDPPKFQQLALGPHKVVEAGNELGLSGQVLGEQSKTAPFSVVYLC